MKKKLRKFLIAGGILSGMFLAGCSTDNKEEATEAVDTENVTLWYYWEAEVHQNSLNEMIEKFNKSQDEYTVQADYVPFAEMSKQLSIGASAQELPDIAIFDNPDFAAFADMGIFADITDEFTSWDFFDQYYEGHLQSTQLDGKYYGVPFGSNNIGLYYNVDMLEDAGIEPPTTWEELKVASQELTVDNRYGFAFSALQNPEGEFNFMPYLWSAGADHTTINSPEGISALEFIGSLVEDGSMPKEAINWTQGDVNSQFMSGNLAMMMNGPWQIPTLENEASDLNWGVTYLPKNQEHVTALGGENYGVIDGDNVEGSLEFIKYMSENTLDYINDFGFISARQDFSEIQFDEGDLNEYYNVFAEMLPITNPRGPHPRWPEISDALSLAMNEVITGSSTPEEAAEKAEAAIQPIINE